MFCCDLHWLFNFSFLLIITLLFSILYPFGIHFRFETFLFSNIVIIISIFILYYYLLIFDTLCLIPLTGEKNVKLEMKKANNKYSIVWSPSCVLLDRAGEGREHSRGGQVGRVRHSRTGPVGRTRSTECEYRLESDRRKEKEVLSDEPRCVRGWLLQWAGCVDRVFKNSGCGSISSAFTPDQTSRHPY